MSNLSGRQFRLAMEDLHEGIGNWRIWYMLGMAEIRQRYRRSTLGPFWLTLSMGVQAMVMGFLMGYLFNHNFGKFLPYLCVSLVLWNFFVNSINEGAMTFISLSSHIMQVKRPLTTYIAQTIWRNAVIFLHTIVIFFVAALPFQLYPTWEYLYLLAGIPLLVLNVGWITLAAALLSTRFRDVPMMLQNIFNILFWLTPVIYFPQQLGQGPQQLITMLNPLTYILEVARAPFMGEVPSNLAWVCATAVALGGWGITMVLFVRVRARIPYWL